MACMHPYRLLECATKSFLILGTHFSFCCRVLAACLAVSAGVMLYVSFVEIFAAKAIDGFETAGFTAAESTRYATLCFFGGMFALWLLDKAVHGVLHVARKTHNKLDSIRKQAQLSSVSELGSTPGDAATPSPGSSEHSTSMVVSVGAAAAAVACASESARAAGQEGAHHRAVHKEGKANVNIEIGPELGTDMKMDAPTESSYQGRGTTSFESTVGGPHVLRGGVHAHQPVAHEAVETILEAEAGAQNSDKKGLSRMGECKCSTCDLALGPVGYSYLTQANSQECDGHHRLMQKIEFV